MAEQKDAAKQIEVNFFFLLSKLKICFITGTEIIGGVALPLLCHFSHFCLASFELCVQPVQNVVQKKTQRTKINHPNGTSSTDYQSCMKSKAGKSMVKQKN